MRTLEQLFENNRRWVAERMGEDPSFFTRLASEQKPQVLWVGCADSRVPANEIIGLDPGEAFVHRNVGNMVIHTDLNCLSVLQYGIDVLQIEHVIICGHYGCGGVKSALQEKRLGLIDNWLRHIQDVAAKYREVLEQDAPEIRQDRLCELNLAEQVLNVCQTTVVQDAWIRGQAVCIHGWIYDLHNGLLQDVGLCVRGQEEVLPVVQEAIGKILTAPPANRRG